MLPFRVFHLLELLKEYELRFCPLDLALNNYFKNHKSLGSKDRKFIKENTFLLIRNRGLIDHLLNDKNLEISWQNRYLELVHPDFALNKANVRYPEFLRLGFSQDLYEILHKEYGDEGIHNFYQVNQYEGPLTIRVNPLKTSREFLMTRWQDVYKCSVCETTPFGITFIKKYSLNHLLEFKQGFFEIQDESSQRTISRITFSKQDTVLDYCAGSGGKSLGLAHLVKKLYLFDVRKKILEEAKRRFQRAGIRNYEIFFSQKDIKKLQKSMDVVLVDVPCSGTGTFRRHPEKIWNFSKKELQKVLVLQRRIVKDSLTFLKPGGRLFYTTCSILFEENEEQITFFEKHYRLKVEGEILKVWPEKNKGDGFFSVCLIQG